MPRKTSSVRRTLASAAALTVGLGLMVTNAQAATSTAEQAGGQSEASAAAPQAGPVAPTPTPTPDVKVWTLPPLSKAPAGIAQPAQPVDMPETYDLSGIYESMGVCSPTPKPGTLKIVDIINATYGDQSYDLGRECTPGYVSEHSEGRAIDWMHSVEVPAERKEAFAFLSWLLATGPDGTPYANAKRLGIMYIGYADQMWRSYGSTPGWSPLNKSDNNGVTRPCTSAVMQANDYDTVCHRDHVHMSLTWDGAAGWNSFWDKTPSVEPFCTDQQDAGTTQFSKAALTITPIPSTLVLDTAKGIGTPEGPCRIHQNGGYGGGYGIRHVVQVAGVGAIPATGVRAVLAKVFAGPSNAPADLTFWPTDTYVVPTTLQIPQLGKASGVKLLPVSSNGTIAVATDAGATDVHVEIVGYMSVPPWTLPGLPLIRARGGTLSVGAPDLLYSTGRTHPVLQPREIRTFKLPTHVDAGALVSVTVTNATKRGNVVLGSLRAPRSVLGADPGAPTANVVGTGVAYRPGDTTVTTAIVQAVNGVVTFQNKGKASVGIRVDLLTGFSSAAVGGLGGMVPMVPANLLKDKAIVPLGSKADPLDTTDEPLVLDVRGTGATVKVPSTATAVALDITTTGVAPTTPVTPTVPPAPASGWLTAWAGTTMPAGHSMAVTPLKATHAIIVVPINADGTFSLGANRDANVSIDVIGYVRPIV